MFCRLDNGDDDNDDDDGDCYTDYDTHLSRFGGSMGVAEYDSREIIPSCLSTFGRENNERLISTNLQDMLTCKLTTCSVIYNQIVSNGKLIKHKNKADLSDTVGTTTESLCRYCEIVCGQKNNISTSMQDGSFTLHRVHSLTKLTTPATTQYEDQLTSFILQRVQSLSSLRHLCNVLSHDTNSVVNLRLDGSRLCVAAPSAVLSRRVGRRASTGKVWVIRFRPRQQMGLVSVKRRWRHGVGEDVHDFGVTIVFWVIESGQKAIISDPHNGGTGTTAGLTVSNEI